MDLKTIMEEHEKIKRKLKILFQTRGKIQSFLDFDDLEIVFVIKPPISDKVLQVAKDMLEINEENGIVIRGKGLFATDQIKKKINRLVQEIENLG